MLEIKNLNVNYGAIRAIRNVSLRVEKGEIVSLIGCNGAGKTTILRAISGLHRPESGSVTLDGIELTQLKAHNIVRKGISQAPERRGIFPNLTVFENLLMGGFTRRLSPADYDKVYGLFPRLGERRQQVAGTLSGGEQQMLAISRALLAQPKVILLDEPSLGLAPQITKTIFETIQRINKEGTTVLLVEQNAHAALKIANRGYVIEVGEIILSDAADKLLHNDDVRKAYLGEI
ncbi:MAG: ABC transporter ATP-binding protein [Deltaproteobacteria bacterium]|nr:ABC transporter ATP-binding protein [Deltaproteobacteria bacterium]MBI3293133.1 ABC transporter ATP-binding protein [Deltaproteobacteria bacterium]